MILIAVIAKRTNLYTIFTKYPLAFSADLNAQTDDAVGIVSCRTTGICHTLRLTQGRVSVERLIGGCCERTLGEALVCIWIEESAVWTHRNASFECFVFAVRVGAGAFASFGGIVCV